MGVVEEIYNAVESLDEEKAEKLVRDALEKKVNPVDIINEGVVKAIKSVGDKFEKQEYFLLELQRGADLAEKLINIVAPHMPKEEIKIKGKIVIATVKGDLHDIGKNLVTLQLSLAGYDVVDMGIDQSTMAIINKAEEVKANIIGLSSLMLTSMPNQAELIKYLLDLGLREKYMVIIGGGPTTKQWADQIGADGWGANAVEAVKVVDELILNKERKGV